MDLIKTAEHYLFFQFKPTTTSGQVGNAMPVPGTIKCEFCGDLMDWVSFDLGHSCRNPKCKLHVAKEAKS